METLLTHIDNVLDHNIDYLQKQINEIKSAYIDVYKDLQKINKNQKMMIKKYQSEPKCSHTIPSHVTSSCCPNRKVYTDYSTIHTLAIPQGVNMIFLTMVGGGGAGGVGCINGFYYYAGGGGGAAACLVKKPVMITGLTILKITVGKGGNQLLGEHGTNSIVEIYTDHICLSSIVVSGGENGHPRYKCDMANISTSGGHGGKSAYCLLDGSNGEDGTTALPSQMCACTGNGGASIMCCGGKGGSNYFSSCNIETFVSPYGQNGELGSGGGGSCPQSMSTECQDKLSGLGGNGMVMVEW